MKRMNKTLSIFLVVVMLVGFLPTTIIDGLDFPSFQLKASAASVPDGYTGIYNVNGLKNIKNNLSGKYILMSDIDLSSYQNWTPIAPDSSNAFSGTLDGNGFKITNLTINQMPSSKNVGLIGYSSGATFQNITIENANISFNLSGSDTWNIGLLCGAARGITVKNTKIQGEVSTISSSGTICFGGIVGKCLTHANISETDITLMLDSNTKKGDFGGLIGYASMQYNVQLTLSKCVTKGRMDIKSSGELRVGGQIGFNYGGNTYRNGTNYIHINVVSSGRQHVGGILADTDNFSTTIKDDIANCCNAGNITVNSSSSNSSIIGGIVGLSDHYITTSSIKQCCNTGSINLNRNNVAISYDDSDYDKWIAVGGITGRFHTEGYHSTNVDNCFNAGNVEIKNCSGTCWYGGIDGSATNVTYCYSVGVVLLNGNDAKYNNLSGGTNCYYLRHDNSDTSGNARSEDEMKKQSTFSGWNFSSIWYFDASKGYNYPLLRNTPCEWDGKYAVKDFAEYALKIIDDITQKPVKDVDVIISDQERYQTDENGNVQFVITNSASYVGKGKKIIITSSGYADYECYLTDLDMYNQNVIRLKGSLWVDVLDATFGKETINGPSVNAFGKEFPLFTVDVGLDLTGIPGMEAFKNLKKANNISIDEATKTIKIMIGLGDGYSVSDKYKWSEDYQAFKEYYQSWHGKTGYNENGEYQGFNNDETLNKYKKIRDKLKPLGKDVVFSANATFCGYAEIDYSSGKCVIKEGGLVMTAEAGLSTDVPIAGIFYATFGIKGTIGTKILWQLQDSGSYAPAFSASLALTPNLGIGAKLISKNVASAEVGLSGTIKGELSLPAESLADSLTISLTAKAYLKAKLLWVLSGSFDFEFANVQLYPELKNNRAKALRAPAIQENDLSPIDRNYLESNNSISVNANDIYPYASPKLAQLPDGTILAFWLTDNGEKGQYNRTTLYYSVNNGMEWSNPVALCENGTADYAPEISVSGNKIHVLWGRASESYTDDSFDIDTALANTELMYCCYENGTFSDAMVISNATGKYQEIYSIASDESGNAVIAWVENSENDYTLSTGNNTIYYREICNGVLQDTVTATENAGILSSITAGYGIDDSAKVAYTTYNDIDGDECYSAVIGETVFSDSSKTYVGITYQNGTYYCIINDELCKYDSADFVPTGLCSINDDYVVLTNGDIVYSVDNGFKNELYVSYFADSEFTAPVRLTEFDKHISAFDVLPTEDGILVFASVDNMNEDENAYPFTTTDLICEETVRKTDIAFSDIVSYEENDIQAGETVSLSSEVKNISTALIDSYIVTLKNGEEVVYMEEFQQRLLPGQTTGIEVDYSIPESFTKTNLTMDVTTANDVDSSNNTASVTLGKSDLQLVDCSINNGVITGILKNAGYDTAAAPSLDIDYFSSDATNIAKIAFEDIEAGEQESFEYTVPEAYNNYSKYYDINRFVLSASTDSEESLYGNNTVDVLGEPIHVTGITQKETDITMLVDETHQLSVTIQPTNVFDKNVIWVSDSTDVATVDDSGLVTAVEKGIAVITAISEDGDFVAACTVNVDCDFDYEKINNDTEIKIINYHGENTVLTIPETLCAGLPITQIGANAIPGSVNSVTLPSTLDTVDAKAFNSASSLIAIYVDERNEFFVSKDGILYSADETMIIRCPIAYDIKELVLSATVSEIGGYAFADVGLNSVILLKSLQIIRNYAFSNNSITTLTIPESVTRIERNAFEKCSNLSTVYYNAIDAETGISSSSSFLIQYLIASKSVFYNDSAIQTIEIGSNVQTLPTGLFVGLSGLQSVNIATESALASIANYTFLNDSALSDVYYGRYYKYWKQISISDGNAPITNATLHCVECNECTWDEGRITTAETCVSTGAKLFICTVCEKERTEIVAIDPNNHVGETSIINQKDPTCTQEGYTGDTICADCKVVLESGTSIPKTEHTWDTGTITHSATCTETGVKTFSCLACPATRTETIDAIGHDVSAEWTIDKEPTCTESGTKSHHCSRCDFKTNITDIDALGHNWNKGEVTTPATCTETGIRTYTCSTCQDTKTETIDALNHDYGDWMQLDENQHQRDCKNDSSHIETENHSWNDGVVTKEASCTENGIRTYTCSVCGATKTAAINSIGHDYGDWTNLNEDQHQRVCKNNSSHIEKESHSWNNGTITKAATCTETGTKTYTCTGCSAKRTETIKATGHNYGAWTLVKAPTCTEAGREQRVCANDNNHIETRSVTKLDHNDRDCDGYCDSCHTDLSSGSETQESNCVCGKYHTGPFAGIIKFFHRIVYFFKNLFNKN